MYYNYFRTYTRCFVSALVSRKIHISFLASARHLARVAFCATKPDCLLCRRVPGRDVKRRSVLWEEVAETTQTTSGTTAYSIEYRPSISLIPLCVHDRKLRNYNLLRLSGFDSATKVVLHITELIHDRRLGGLACGLARNNVARVNTPRSLDTSRGEFTERRRFRAT